ncbi:hypothetical protein HK105_201375 [Polyrhizophydium stewartii]|uniref:N-acetyltransferase domain-containing protein n=1 Tax=Polyrhizophydium stewartii TaxID=2732419 RepID=A0ABR4NHV3_9FUNG|nr:hypothetical protein HK105_007750 [Polyrhizophydium stewartii]
MSLLSHTPIADPGPSEVLPRARLTGRRLVLEPLTPALLAAHAAELHQYACVDDDLYAYMPSGPFADAAAYSASLDAWATSAGQQAYLITDKTTGRIAGLIGYLNVQPVHRTVELGRIWVARAFQGQSIAVEATYLLLAYAFDVCGFVRCEWKCHYLNVPSQRSATSIGFIYEGTFRKHMFYKGMVRHTMWYALTDDDWPDVARKLVARIADMPRIVPKPAVQA